MGWLRLVGSLQLYVSFAKEPCKRDYILQKRLRILRGLLIVATPYPIVPTSHIALYNNYMSLWQNIVSFIGLFCKSDL